MLILLRMVGLFIQAIREGASPRLVGGGIALGLAMGLIPGWPLLVWLLAVVLLVFAFNLAAAAGGLLLGGLLGWLIAPWLDALGALVLGTEWLQGLWTALYNSWLGDWLRFSNTQVLGGMLAALLLGGGGAPLFVRLVRNMRSLDPRWLDHPLVKWGAWGLNKLGLVRLYNTLRRLGLV